jgi:hypothetical protein
MILLEFCIDVGSVDDDDDDFTLFFSDFDNCKSLRLLFFWSKINVQNNSISQLSNNNVYNIEYVRIHIHLTDSPLTIIVKSLNKNCPRH